MPSSEAKKRVEAARKAAQTRKANSTKVSKPATRKRPAKPKQSRKPDFAKQLGRDDLGPAELRWLEQQVNHPVPEKGLDPAVGQGSHNPLQGRPF